MPRKAVTSDGNEVRALTIQVFLPGVIYNAGTADDAPFRGNRGTERVS